MIALVVLNSELQNASDKLDKYVKFSSKNTTNYGIIPTQSILNGTGKFEGYEQNLAHNPEFY